MSDVLKELVLAVNPDIFSEILAALERHAEGKDPKAEVSELVEVPTRPLLELLTWARMIHMAAKQ